jgi:hypothetical protein
MIAARFHGFFFGAECAGIDQVSRVAYVAVLWAEIVVSAADDPAALFACSFHRLRSIVRQHAGCQPGRVVVARLGQADVDPYDGVEPVAGSVDVKWLRGNHRTALSSR